jgi:foldase protein PrsA
MNNSIKKTLAILLTVAMLATGTTLLSACKAQTASTTTAADATSANSTAASTVLLTKDTGTASTTTAATTAPVVLPSVATGTITVDGQTVSAVEYDFYYYMIYQNYSQYASYGAVPTGADGSFDLTAACTMSGYETKTWGDYIKSSALKQLQDTYILANYATKAGMALTAADQTTISSFYSSVQKYADTYSMTVDAYLATMYGAKANKADLDPVISRYLLASQYMTGIEKAYTFTDAELQAFYTTNKDSYKNTDLPTVRHILFMAPVGVSGYSDATADQLANAKTLAEAALAKIKTYDDMVSVGAAALADGSAAESTEYTVATGDMVQTFEDWCYDTSRKPGDTGIIQTEYGYHVMYFVKTQKDWMADAISSLTTAKYKAYIAEQEALPEFAITQS